MLNRKRFLPAALLCLAGLVPLWADAQEESLWGYADPTADLCIYINTKQAEKAMEKGLWDRIQQAYLGDIIGIIHFISYQIVYIGCKSHNFAG